MRSICCNASQFTAMKERSKEGTFVKRLQYILMFATLFSFVYLLVIINVVEPIANLRGPKSVPLNSSKPTVNTTKNEDLTEHPFFKLAKKISWNFQVENMVAEIGADLKSNSTPSNIESKEPTESAVPKIDENIVPPTESHSENLKLSGAEASTEKIEHFRPKSLKKIDWHNYQQIEYEKERQGFGEQGKPVILELDISKIFQPGYTEHLGDRVALNRSIPDTRHKKCFNKLYLESLPSASVVIPFYNEHMSTLLRTVHSVINRSPPQLLKEVILVDDTNKEWEQRDEFYKYMSIHLPEVKIIVLHERSGTVAARMAGARNATGDVLVILDSHIEANVNWLPPLLEPIALDYRTVVLPQIDVIESTNFEYHTKDGSGRGVFDWQLRYNRLPLPPRDERNLPEPYETPVMRGGNFAISRAFFLELGGYDPGLMMWAGEQFELSFKIWQCGGRMLEAPCSTIGHVNKINSYSDAFNNKNIRRVALVWMDEYSQYLYQRMPDLLTVDPGDLTDQRALRERLHCKPFRWYMEQVAFDIPNKFPMTEPTSFAEGRIRPMDRPKLCADAHTAMQGGSVVLKKCLEHPERQEFYFSWQKDIRLKGTNLCWTVPDPAVFEDAVYIQTCTGISSQIWKYNPESRKITFGGYDTLCLEKQRRSLFLNHCHDDSPAQAWLIDHVDHKRIEHWGDTTRPVTGPKGHWTD